MDLNRSVRLLEDAISPHGRSLLRTGTPKKSKNLVKDRYVTDKSLLDLSVTVAQDEMRYLLEGGMSYVDHSLQNILQNSTLTGSALASNKPWENAADALYMECLEVIQARTSVHEIFETVSDLARCCTDTLNVIKGLKSKVRTTITTDEKWLENERNTWRLIYCLYQDRLNSESQENNIMPYLGVSEKLCVENLYKRDSLVRESQLIIDWLECNALDQESNEPKVQYFTNRTIGWENTLHQLQASDSIAFKSTRPIVTRMDPDAPLRQNLPLHDLDIEDEERICRKIFRDIRCGRLEEAQALSLHCGHPWRAALLEGWRLHHDPNLNYTDNNDEQNMETGEIYNGNLTVEKIREKTTKRTQKSNIKAIEPIEGNVNRDIWKKIAWEYCHEVCFKITRSLMMLYDAVFLEKY